jgi:hypothetical protein
MDTLSRGCGMVSNSETGGSAVIKLSKSKTSAAHGEAGYERRANDAYFTEPWITRLLTQYVQFAAARAAGRIWEPACGDGRMVRPLEAAGYRVFASDIADHGFLKPFEAFDFLAYSGMPDDIRAIVTNPPFDRAREFAAKAVHLMEQVGGQVAMLQRHDWDAAQSNRPLFLHRCYDCKIVLPRRPKWAEEDKAAPRFAYAWFCWRAGRPPGLSHTIYADHPDKGSAPGELDL